MSREIQDGSRDPRSQVILRVQEIQRDDKRSRVETINGSRGPTWALLTRRISRLVGPLTRNPIEADVRRDTSSHIVAHNFRRRTGAIVRACHCNREGQRVNAVSPELFDPDKPEIEGNASSPATSHASKDEAPTEGLSRDEFHSQSPTDLDMGG